MDRSVPRDQGPLHHQRAVLLTHDATIQRRAEYVNHGLDLGNVISNSSLPKPDRLQLQRDAKLVGGKRKREFLKAAEDARKATLTAEELAQEKAAHKVAADAKKVKKAQEFAAAEARLKTSSSVQI